MILALTVLMIYDAVLTMLREQGGGRLEQRPFFVCLNKRIREILMRYPDSALPEGVIQPRIDSLEDPIMLREAFFYPLVWGILYEAGAGEGFGADAIRAAKDADRSFRTRKDRFIYKRRF